LGPQADRVERIARGLDADLREHLVLAVFLERQPVGERLGNRLEGEGLARVADLVDEPVARGNADAEPVRIGARKLGNVVRDPAVREAQETGAQRLQVFEDRGSRQGRSAGHVLGNVFLHKPCPSSVVPVVRIERTTYRLQGGCSTPELNRPRRIISQPG
jgi:hypothetical protein